jgi:hypothetical protein
MERDDTEAISMTTTWHALDSLPLRLLEGRAAYLKHCGLDPSKIFRVKIDLRSMTAIVYEYNLNNGSPYLKGNSSPSMRRPYRAKLKPFAKGGFITVGAS